jgi:hypothetical protein
MKWESQRRILSFLSISAISATGKHVKTNAVLRRQTAVFSTSLRGNIRIVSKYIYLLGWRPLQAKLFKLYHHPLVRQASAQRIITFCYGSVRCRRQMR